MVFENVIELWFIIQYINSALSSSSAIDVDLLYL